MGKNLVVTGIGENSNSCRETRKAGKARKSVRVYDGAYMHGERSGKTGIKVERHKSLPEHKLMGGNKK